MTSEIRKIGVLGAGQMGSGIAQIAAQSAFEVILVDQDPVRAEQAVQQIGLRLKKLVEKAKITEAASHEARLRIHTADHIKSFAQVDLVIEAVAENSQIKFSIFKQLDEICSAHTVFASNTSSISITAIAAQTKRPEQVAGMHFMNPVPLMKLVEGIQGLQTSTQTFRVIRNVAEKMGKTFIEAKDQPGFAVNRILMPMINEAITVFYEGIASATDIDFAMTLGTHQPMGPLALADFIGLDTCLAIMEVLHEGLGDSKYRPSTLLKRYVAAGWLGKKSGRGFYNYEN